MRELNIQESQSVSLEILKIIADICEANEYRYFLMYGTLIGAIRHDGCIPWDDDIDIMMPRPDYSKLLDYLSDHISDYKHLKVFNPDTCAEYPYMITRVSDIRYKVIMENEKDYGMGAFIDIYPFDGLGNTQREALKFGLKGDRISSLCYQSTRLRCATEVTTSFFRKLIKLPVFLFSKACGKNIFQRKLKKLEGVKQYDQYTYVGCIVWLSGGIKDIFKREWFEEYEKHKFESYEFRIPKQYDQVLRHTYNDYMKLPPEKDRIGHHFYHIYKK